MSGLGTLGFKDRAGNTVIGGIAQEIVDRLGRMHGTLGHNPCPVLNSLTPVNAALVRLLLFEMCGEVGVQMLLGCTFVAARYTGTGCAVYVQGRAKRFEVEAQVFIDATGDGDRARALVFPLRRRPRRRVTARLFDLRRVGVKKENCWNMWSAIPPKWKHRRDKEMNVDAAFFSNGAGI